MCSLALSQAADIQVAISFPKSSRLTAMLLSAGGCNISSVGTPGVRPYSKKNGLSPVDSCMLV